MKRLGEIQRYFCSVLSAQGVGVDMEYLARSISEIRGTIALQAAHLATLYLAPEWEYPFLIELH